jgi:hypothetical protein
MFFIFLMPLEKHREDFSKAHLQNPVFGVSKKNITMSLVNHYSLFIKPL